jgi:hypothetical protein
MMELVHMRLRRALATHDQKYRPDGTERSEDEERPKAQSPEEYGPGNVPEPMQIDG